MKNVIVDFDETQQIFHIGNKYVSYIIELSKERHLLHRYYGERIRKYHKANCPTEKRRTFAANPYPDDRTYSFERLPMEFPQTYTGDYREPILKVKRENGYSLSNFIFKRYEIQDKKEHLKGLPHTFDCLDTKSKSLWIYLFDEQTEAETCLKFTIFDDSPVVVKSMEVKNKGKEILTLNSALSNSFDFPDENFDVVSFYGSHEREFQITRFPIRHGKFLVESLRGTSSPQYPPFIALCDSNTNDTSGRVIAFNLIYSGNHLTQVELDQYRHVRVSNGINPKDFSWELKPGDSFQTPEIVIIHSNKGFNGMSHGFHVFFQNHLVNPHFKNKERPILLNSWEMCYFDLSEERIKKIIDKAAILGFELFVIDDGWHGNRNNSSTSLGDWTVSKQKFPNGLEPIAEYAKEKNIELGLWFEPEMFTPDSALKKEHPDWCVQVPDYPNTLGRSQHVLDFSLEEVQNFIISTIKSFLIKYPISYIKWDMNRHITEPGSSALSGKKTPEFFHRYMLGLYRVLEELTCSFPKVLFENCSSGGGRFDAGMSYYMPQTWCSDNSDGYDRQKIQYGSSYLFHPIQIGSHVTATPNHQTMRELPLETRMRMAESGNLGYEMSILDLSREEESLIGNHLKWYKVNRQLIQKGDFYRLRSPYEHLKECAWIFINKVKTKAILYLFTNLYKPTHDNTLIKIPYLDSNKDYIETRTKRIFGGDELSSSGLSIDLKKGDFNSYKFELEAIKLK
jgi:Alpha-galactosidase